MLKSNKISVDEELSSRICRKAKECFVEALKNFEEDISPKNFQLIVASLSSTPININTSLNTTPNDLHRPKENRQSIKNGNNINIDLKKLKENFEAMPTCAEKCILSLIFHLNLKLEEKSSISNELID